MKFISSKKWVVAFASVIPFALLKASLAQTVAMDTAGEDVGTSAAQSMQVDAADYEGYAPDLRTACGADSDIVKAAYHAEAQTVDLSDFDGCSITVDAEDMDGHSPNGE